MIIEKNPENPEQYFISVIRNLDLGQAYVARITNSCMSHRFKREFLEPHLSFKRRTIYLVSEPGYYEIITQDKEKTNKERKNYFKFTGTSWDRISRRDLEKIFPLGVSSSYE